MPENVKQFMKSWKMFLAVQGGMSAIFMLMVIMTGVLPFRYLMMILIILAVLMIGSFLLLRPGEYNTSMIDDIRRFLGKALAVFISFCLVIVCVYINLFTGLLKRTMNKSKETITYSLVVKQESSYQKAADLNGKSIAYNPNLNDDILPDVISALSKECTSYQAQYVYNYGDLADALYNKNAEAILMNEAFRDVLIDAYEKFDTETRVIWSVSVTVENDTGKDYTKYAFGTDGLSILISGIDSRGGVNETARSDVNMILTYNPGTHVMLLTSVPRDYYVEIADIQAQDKLTHSGLTGTQNTVDTINKLMGTNIDFYVRVNFQALVKLVDSLGGIDIFSDIDLTPWMNGRKGITQGWNHINGEQALFFCRERYAYKNGDVHRAANQQEVLRAIIQKMSSPRMITNYMSIMNSMGNSFVTNLPSYAITQIANEQIDSGEAWQIYTSILDGTGKEMKGGYYMPNKTLYYMMPDEESIAKNAQYIKYVLDGTSFSMQ